VQYYVW